MTTKRGNQASRPTAQPPSAERRNATHWNTAWCVSMSMSRRVREMVEWSGTLSSSAIRTNERIDRLSLARQAIPRSDNSVPVFLWSAAIRGFVGGLGARDAKALESFHFKWCLAPVHALAEDVRNNGLIAALM